MHPPMSKAEADSKDWEWDNRAQSASHQPLCFVFLLPTSSFAHAQQSGGRHIFRSSPCQRLSGLGIRTFRGLQGQAHCKRQSHDRFSSLILSHDGHKAHSLFLGLFFPIPQCFAAPLAKADGTRHPLYCQRQSHGWHYYNSRGALPFPEYWPRQYVLCLNFLVLAHTLTGPGLSPDCSALLASAPQRLRTGAHHSHRHCRHWVSALSFFWDISISVSRAVT